MAALTDDFTQRIEQAAEGVWMAIGYGLANSLLIEGDNGLIVIDTLETLATGAEVAKQFRALSDKPLAAIMYMHNHAGHGFGAESFVAALAHSGKPVQVLAHANTASYVHRVVSEFRPIISARSYRMFDTELEADISGSDGIGIDLKIDQNSEFGSVEPTTTFNALGCISFLKLFKPVRAAAEPAPFATLDCCD